MAVPAAEVEVALIVPLTPTLIAGAVPKASVCPVCRMEIGGKVSVAGFNAPVTPATSPTMVQLFVPASFPVMTPVLLTTVHVVGVFDVKVTAGDAVVGTAELLAVAEIVPVP